MLDISLQLIFFRIVALVVAAAVHGAALATIAGLLGDRGPQYDGRRTLNPAAHLDLVGSIGAIVFALGWIKPVAIDEKTLRVGRIGPVAIALGGLLALVVLAVVFDALKQPALRLIGGNFGLNAVALLDRGARFSLSLAAFNILPIPPLTGGLFLKAAAPRLFAILERNRPAVVVVLALLIVGGVADSIVSPLYGALAVVIGR